MVQWGQKSMIITILITIVRMTLPDAVQDFSQSAHCTSRWPQHAWSWVTRIMRNSIQPFDMKGSTSYSFSQLKQCLFLVWKLLIATVSQWRREGNLTALVISQNVLIWELENLRPDEDLISTWTSASALMTGRTEHTDFHTMQCTRKSTVIWFDLFSEEWKIHGNPVHCWILSKSCLLVWWTGVVMQLTNKQGADATWNRRDATENNQTKHMRLQAVYCRQ